MSKVCTSIDQLIGHTPLLELTHFEADEDLKARVLVKLEYFNPAGSVKDRVAKNMIDEAEKAGKLVRGGDYTIIEPTSGNTGVGIASVAAARGYKVIITMPETMSVERRKLMQAYGAQLVLTDGSKGMKGAIAKAEELQKETPNSIIAGQFVNPANPAIHKATTGPEIWNDTDGEVDIFVAGVGTGGTVTGVGEFLKEQNPEIQASPSSPPPPRCSLKARPARTRSRVSVPALCPTSSTPRSTTRSSPSRTTTPLPPAAPWATRRACSWAFRPAPPCGPHCSWPSAPRTRARPSWRCSPTPASATCPRHSSRTRALVPRTSPRHAGLPSLLAA